MRSGETGIGGTTVDSADLTFAFSVFAVVWLIVAIASRNRVKRLEARVAQLAAENQRHTAAGTVLYQRIEALRVRVEADEAELARARAMMAAPTIAAAPATEATGTLEPVAARHASAPSPAAPAPEAAAAPPAQGLPAVPPATSAEATAIAPTAVSPAEAPGAAPPAPSVPVTEAPTPANLPAAEPIPSPPDGVPSAESPPALEPPAPAPPAATEPPVSHEPPADASPSPPPSSAGGRRGLDWESLVGVRLFSWISGIALVLGAVLFLRYSIEQGLLGPPIRLAIGILSGVALLVVSETRGRSKWNVTADALGAAGIAILFATFFAADALWHLLPQPATFALMVLVTTVAVLLAIRHDSVFIALLGLVGGFATPILLSTGEDRPIGLFSYLIILNVGLAWVGRRRGWTVLIALSVAFTAVYQWGWLVRFVLDRPAELPIAVVVFLAFPVLVAMSRLVPPRDDARPAPSFEHTATASALLPLLFALCFAWVPAFADHYVLLFAYLFLLDLALATIAVATRNRLLHGAAAFATVLVFAGWLPVGYGSYAWPGVLGFVSLFVTFFLLAPVGARWLAPRLDARAALQLTSSDSPARPPIELGDARVAAPLLLFTIPALAYLEPATASPVVLFAVMFLLLALIATVALLEEAGPLYFVAAFFAVVAEAVWSAKHLGPANLHAALLLYGAFGLFHLGVPLLAHRFGRKLDPGWGPPSLLLASLALLLFLAGGPVAHLALWGMAILLAILNLGLFFDRRPGPVSWLAALGMMLSWVVIAVWWASAMVASLLLPALAIVGGFAVLLIGGNLWADSAGGSGAGDTGGRKAVYLGLVGHLFLLFVATQPALAAPPWPLLGVLFVLDLAILVAALYARRGELHVSTVAASQVVIFVWVCTTHDIPAPGLALAWSEVGILATLGIAAMALGALALARRRGVTGALFPAAAAVALVGAQCVGAVAGAYGDGAPAVPWLVAAGAIPLVALAWLAAETQWYWLVTVALAPYFLGMAAWIASAPPTHPRPWRMILVLAAVPYAVWLANPIWLGVRGLRSRSPHVAAVLASGIFFVFGHRAMVTGGFESVIGILPVVQAILLVGSLMHVLHIARGASLPTVDADGDHARDRGRLALVAGAALAFVTVAIPLQLDKQWITIGWGLEAAALAWLYLRIVHKGLLGTSAALSLAVVLRLSLNRAVLSYHPRGAHPILNWYLYAYLVSAIALLVASSLLAGADDRFDKLPALPRVSSLMRAGATLLLFLLVNIEIADYWSSGSEITFNFSSDIAQDLTYTLGWAVFAIVLLAVGIVRKSRAARLAALLLLVVTVAKAFLHDLWRLGGLYRVGSFVGLALSLALVAVVLQRFVLPPDPKHTKKKAP